MASFNRVVLMGNLTRDPELRYLQTGMAVADITLAVNDRRKTATGEWVDEATFVDVTLWGRTAETASEYLTKGSPALIEGRLKMESWEKDGQKRTKLKVVCEQMRLISSRGQGGPGGGGGGERPQSAARPAQRSGGSPYNQSGPPDDFDIPPPDAHSSGGGGGDDIPF